MNYRDILSLAESNKKESGFELPAKPQNKKVQRSGVQSDGVRRFLAKKKAEEEAKVAEARKLREQLLSIRAQNSKNNKKAKIMASRTKDNDFSRIKLTEDEIESKKKIEIELQRKQLADKVERMKIRIEMEEKDKLLPRKRKRKSKLNATEESSQREEQQIIEEVRDYVSSKEQEKPKRPRPRPPPTSYSDLLKIAEQKKHEPIVIPKKKKEDDRPLTKKERKLYEEQLERERRNRERLKKGASLRDYKIPNEPKQQAVATNKKPVQEKETTKKPLVVHVEKNPISSNRVKSIPAKDERLKVNKSSVDNSAEMKHSRPSAPPDKNIPKTVDKSKLPVKNVSKSSLAPKSFTNHNRETPSKVRVAHAIKAQPKPVLKDDANFLTKQPPIEKTVKKKPEKIAPVAATPPVPQLDTAALAAAIAKQVREDLEKQMEEKYAAKFAMLEKAKANESAKAKSLEKPKSSSSASKAHPSVNGSVSHKSSAPPIVSKQYSEKPVVKAARPAAPPPPAKKPFHINPYLDPPRRRLEPVRPPKPVQKRRIESDDEDDDMSDFIDDGHSQNDEDYSKYIKEIFGYDRNRYADDDDDDIVESSFAEQMKEEVRSAKLGFLEDLEEERKNRELEKKWKQKQKLKK